jgi:hypothetical protein
MRSLEDCNMSIAKHQVMKALNDMFFTYDPVSPTKKISLDTVVKTGFDHCCMGPSDKAKAMDQLAEHLVERLNESV